MASDVRSDGVRVARMGEAVGAGRWLSNTGSNAVTDANTLTLMGGDADTSAAAAGYNDGNICLTSSGSF
jgi:hypothetical protein